MSGTRYFLELRPAPDGPDHLVREPVVRVRALLKIAGRRYGLRCTRIAAKPSEEHAKLLLSEGLEKEQ